MTARRRDAAATADGRVKGTAMIGAVTALRARRDHAEPLLNADLRVYLESPVLVSSWYPESDWYALLGVLVHFAPKAAADPWEWMGSMSAANDLDRIYAAMVQRGQPRATLERLPRLWRLYHDTGRAEVGIAREIDAANEGETRQACEVLVSGYAHASDTFGRLMCGYLATMLELSGAGDARVTLVRAGLGGTSARWQAAWTEG